MCLFDCDQMLTRILLDTCVVGNHLDQVEPRLDLEGIYRRRWKYRISLADTTVELLEGLIDGTLTERWNKHVHEIDAILDTRWPIFPGGRFLSAITSVQTELSIGLEEEQAYRKALWRLMRASCSPIDLERGITFEILPGERRSIKGDRALIEQGLTDYRRDWISYIDRLRSEIQAGQITASSAQDLKKLMDQDFGTRAEDPPDMAKKLDGVTSLIAQFIHLSLQKRDPYNPSSKKRRGDVFDLCLLYALPVPVIIVTGDEKFLSRLRMTQAPSAQQVISVPEFNSHVKQDTLESLLTRIRSASDQQKKWNEAAYLRWKARGCPVGDDWADWFATEPLG